MGAWFATWQIGRRRAAHLAKNPDAKIISLGIGDTTEPIPTVITDAMVEVRIRTRGEATCAHTFVGWLTGWLFGWSDSAPRGCPPWAGTAGMARSRERR